MSDKSKSIAHIDKHCLDDALVQQPELYEEYAFQLEEARADLEDAKNELKVKEDDYEVACAKMDLAIRQNPKNHGLDKVTEGAIRSAILLTIDVTLAQKCIQSTREEIVRLQRIFGALKATVDVLDYKKRSLEDLCKLRLANYYSEPRLPKGKEDVRSEIIDEKRRKIYKKHREANDSIKVEENGEKEG